MDERVQEFLKRTQQEIARRDEALSQRKEAQRKAQREELLIRLGLCEREEAEKVPFGESEWRWDTEKVVYYRYRALPLSDEEYEAVLSAEEELGALRREEQNDKQGGFLAGLSHTASQKPLGGNRVAQILRIFAWVLFIVGLNFGIILGARVPEAKESFDLVRMLLTWVAFAAGGLFFYGLSEIVFLLGGREKKDGEKEEKSK